MCSGKEQLIRNLHRSSKGAPKRKEKMKKTIAILLVLVIGMVGVFAETEKTLELTTTVKQLTGFKVTQEAIGDGDKHNFSKFTALDERTTVEVSTNSTGDLSATAFLTVANNSTTSFSVGVKGVEMTSTDQDPTSSKIQYTYKVGSDVARASLTTSALEDANFVEALKVTGTIENGMQIESAAITVVVDSNDYNSAAAGNYAGTLYFNITTT